MKMNAYDSSLLYNARTRMAWMLDFAVNVYNVELDKFYHMFLRSEVSGKIEAGNPSVIEGKSGRELAYQILCEGGYDDEMKRPDRYLDRSEEYWAGSSLAYFQWETSLGFGEIEEFCNISEIRQLYMPYHEMDISKFCGRLSELYLERNTESQLKKIRKLSGISQKMLAESTKIPLKTIQQYEQRQKNINHARVDYLIALSRELSCDIEALIEKI